MAEPHVISALVKKRAELLGEIQNYEKLLKKSKLNLQSIDQTIHIFDETYDLRTIRAKRVHKERYFKTGESKLLILDILRGATEPLSTSEIGAIIPSNKGIDTQEDYNSEKFFKIVLASLSRCENSNLVERVGLDGKVLLWQIKKG